MTNIEKFINKEIDLEQLVKGIDKFIAKLEYEQLRDLSFGEIFRLYMFEEVKDDDNGWYGKEHLTKNNFDKIEIPTYTEYIPPKPILDDKEKEYLSYVIRPFRKNIYGIIKRKCDGCDYITLFNSRGYNIDLPFFQVDTMYKGMELDREYSLEELGL